MKETHQFLEKGGKKSHFLKPISLTAIPLLWSPSLNVCLRAVYALCMRMPGALKALTINSGAWGFAGFSSKTRAGKRRIPKQPDYVSISAVYYPAKRAWWHTGDRRQPSAASQGILRHSYQNTAQKENTFIFLICQAGHKVSKIGIATKHFSMAIYSLSLKMLFSSCQAYLNKL